MYETTQKTITMTLEEFKAWEVSKGWKMTNLNGSLRTSAVSADAKWDRKEYFEIRVTIEKEK